MLVCTRRPVAFPPRCIQDDIETQFQCSPDEVVMVGDRILTDVVFGRRHGMFCILSEPLARDKDRWAVQASRLFENWLAPAVSRLPSVVLGRVSLGG